MSSKQTPDDKRGPSPDDGFSTGPYRSGWRAFDPPDQATVMEVRAQLLLAARSHMRHQGWSTSEAADRFGVKRSTIKDIRGGRVDHLDTELLLRMIGCAGLAVDISVKSAEVSANE
ncbi:XRE family transcriptional regulator [Rhodococcoides kyotonense]|uniref:XRE family transcriptional regulator n=1 Tax=Rhodococcoides kyotonense TaxID=398843 RepID=UPI000B76D170